MGVPLIFEKANTWSCHLTGRSNWCCISCKRPYINYGFPTKSGEQSAHVTLLVILHTRTFSGYSLLLGFFFVLFLLLLLLFFCLFCFVFLFFVCLFVCFFAEGLLRIRIKMSLRAKKIWQNTWKQRRSLKYKWKRLSVAHKRNGGMHYSKRRL